MPGPFFGFVFGGGKRFPGVSRFAEKWRPGGVYDETTFTSIITVLAWLILQYILSYEYGHPGDNSLGGVCSFFFSPSPFFKARSNDSPVSN